MYSSNKCLVSYKSGILTESECKCSNPDKETVNHAVTIVGYGKADESERPDCSEYWLVKNSWGADWGIEGFFKLCMDKTEATKEVGICQVNSYVQYPTLD